MAEYTEVITMDSKPVRPPLPSTEANSQQWLEWLLKVTDYMEEDLGKKETKEIMNAILYYLTIE